MFGFFKKQEYIVPEKLEHQEPPEPEVNVYEPAPYTIGVNQHGMTQVVFRTNIGMSTLSLDPRSVRHFIKMLECTIQSEPDDSNDNTGDAYD
jgi:hypothetical protein